MTFQKKCCITELKRLYDGCFSLTAQMGEIARAAQPGQFVHVSCGEGNLLRRPLSICCVDGDSLTVVFEVRGKGTKWLSERAVGDQLDILGPLGHGFSIPTGNLLVVGGGIGVPPMLFTAQHAAGGVTALLGFRNESRIILADCFSQVCRRVIVATDDGSNGFNGPVTIPMQQILQTESFDAVLCCGPTPMLKAVAGLCIDKKIPCQVSMEQRMGCGIGACLVCSCKTKRSGTEHMSRVCADGPVFDAREVVWDG